MPLIRSEAKRGYRHSANLLSMTVTVDELEVTDPTDAWTRAGFSVGSDAVSGSAASAYGSSAWQLTGIVGWSLRGLPRPHARRPRRHPDEDAGRDADRRRGHRSVLAVISGAERSSSNFICANQRRTPADKPQVTHCVDPIVRLWLALGRRSCRSASSDHSAAGHIAGPDLPAAVLAHATSRLALRSSRWCATSRRSFRCGADSPGQFSCSRRGWGIRRPPVCRRYRACATGTGLGPHTAISGDGCNIRLAFGLTSLGALGSIAYGRYSFWLLTRLISVTGIWASSSS